MNSAQIRSAFRDFYIQRGHTPIASSSLVPSSYDPSVLLTTAGMQQFKPYFLQIEQPPATRLTSVQKCFRTPDIDEVGNTARHLTFFEMLGNFSFGDYFKQGAIEMAWELLTGVLKLDPAKLWTTVHEGNASMKLGLDTEARDLWIAQGVPAERIVPLGADNFWKAGPTGPCGPCTEIYVDRGPRYQVGCPDTDACKPGCDCDRYLEVYNLVFMQYSRDEAGVLTPLPKQNIDTGMGVERLASVLEDVPSVFDTTDMRALIAHVENESGRTYDDGDAVATKAMRVLCDHGRGMTFLASDGVMPSNEGRGYVLRRIIRRAIQQADRIGMYDGGKTGVLERLSAFVVRTYGDEYPELRAQRDIVIELLNAEEVRFLATLSSGTDKLNAVLADLAPGAVVDGDHAFQLHDTYGFPWELTLELAEERGFTVDRARFDELMQQQRERARAAAGGGSLPTEQAAAFVRSGAPTNFTGYTDLVADTTVTAFERVGDGSDGRVLIKLATSPFYAEGGGQVADTGIIAGQTGRASVEHVMRFESDQVIVARLDGELAVGEAVCAQVDSADRLATESNHTATHLLHRALRDHLGEHVRQAGSLVEPGRLRFDFVHTQSMSAEEIAAVETDVNAFIAAGLDVGFSERSIDEARELGAMMLFGEKYGDVVRVVDVGNGESRELCGGTHVSNTSQISTFLVTGESSVGANTRRIEAITGAGAIRYLRHRAELAEQAARAAGVDVERLVTQVSNLSETSRKLERELSQLRSGSVVDDAVAAAQQAGGINVVAFRADGLSGDELLDLSDRLKNKLAPAAVLVGSVVDGKVQLVAGMSDEAIAAGIKAGDVVGAAAKVAGGGGGGRPNMARAGGKDPSKIDDALKVGLDAMLAAAGAAV